VQVLAVDRETRVRRRRLEGGAGPGVELEAGDEAVELVRLERSGDVEPQQLALRRRITEGLIERQRLVDPVGVEAAGAEAPRVGGRIGVDGGIGPGGIGGVGLSGVGCRVNGEVGDRTGPVRVRPDTLARPAGTR
jgi:hypothetical protein